MDGFNWSSKKQELQKNNFTKNMDIDINLVKKLMINNDIDILEKLQSKIFCVNDIKINIIKKMLKTNAFELKTKEDIIEFFKILSPLNIEYNFGFNDWNYKFDNKKLYIHNCILSNNNCLLLNELYLNDIKNILQKSNIKYKYYEIKNRRYYRTVDIIFTIDI